MYIPGKIFLDSVAKVIFNNKKVIIMGNLSVEAREYARINIALFTNFPKIGFFHTVSEL